ncbi:hypothetical protein BK351_28020 [Escherichia coli]|nr:hypothetical protein BK351_28020 [Escherichia coli]
MIKKRFSGIKGFAPANRSLFLFDDIKEVLFGAFEFAPAAATDRFTVQTKNGSTRIISIYGGRELDST